MTFSEAFFLLRSAGRNSLVKKDLWYVVESANWAIKSVGEHITQELTQQKLLSADITATPWRIRNSLVHFGSLHTLTWHGKQRPVDSSNTIITTVFHLIPNKQTSHQLQDILKTSQKIHTSSQITKKALLQASVSAERIHVLPLGINTQLFRPFSREQKISLREKLGIPKDVFVIGSFQKDGVGWEKGLKPKLEKGPDIFVKVMAQVNEQYPIHVLLTGPARGFVKQELERAHVSFTDIGYIHQYEAVARYYQALDAYLITSRVEGGPLALLEAWASKISVISTRVGMVPDIARHREHALLAHSEDVDALAEHVISLINNPQQAHLLAQRAFDHSQQFDWSLLIKHYYDVLYKPFI